MPTAATAAAEEEWFLNGATGSLTSWRHQFPTHLLIADPSYLAFLQELTVPTKNGQTGVLSSVHAQLLHRRLLTVKPDPECFAEPYLGPTDHDGDTIVALINREAQLDYQLKLARATAWPAQPAAGEMRRRRSV